MLTVAMNDTNEDMEYTLYLERQTITLTIPAAAMQTIVYKQRKV